MIHAIIMAGGAGTRFWPASRTALPKQLLNLTGGETMIQATVSRLSPLVPAQRILVVTNQRLVGPIREQLPQLPATAILGEPCKRDTAPCVGLAAFWVSRDDPDATMVVMPSDHVITATDRFQGALSHAARLVDASPERLITFGVTPTYPAETFGYIQRGRPLADEASSGSGPPTFVVERFREKPDAATASEYLESGEFFWNAGIFVWKARTILDQLARHEPEMHEHLATIADTIGTSEFEQVFCSEFEQIQGRSIDYAVMEKAHEVAVVQAPFDWDDLGSWQAVPRLCGTDEDGNSVSAKHLSVDTTGTIVRGTDDHLIVTVGLEDCIVVHTPDATLVARRDNEESIRKVVKLLEERGWLEYL